MSNRLMQTYLFQGDEKRFFVSTIHRESSAPVMPALWFYETFAWALNHDGTRGDLVEDNSGAMDIHGATLQHAETCSRLLNRVPTSEAFEPAPEREAK